MSLLISDTTTIADEQAALWLPIGLADQQWASQWADQLPAAEQADRRRRLLALQSLRFYLQLMGVATNLAESDCLNPVLACRSGADLRLPMGRLECLVVDDGRQGCDVPPETWDDRLSYVVVRLDEANARAELVGFVSTLAADPSWLPLSMVQPIEALIEGMAAASVAASAPTSVSDVVADSGSQTAKPAAQRLGDWLTTIGDDATQAATQLADQLADAGWLVLDQLLSGGMVNLAYRSVALLDRQTEATPTPSQPPSQLRGKLLTPRRIDDVVMLVTITQSSPSRRTVAVQLQPWQGARLPEGLVLRFVANGKPIAECQSGPSDDSIQTELSGIAGEAFEVEVRLRDAQAIESFVL
jgi:Protein of unknown function (DUF1822)